MFKLLITSLHIFSYVFVSLILLNSFWCMQVALPTTIRVYIKDMLMSFIYVLYALPWFCGADVFVSFFFFPKNYL